MQNSNRYINSNLKKLEFELGRKMLSESGLSIISANGLTDAAQQAVAAVKV